ncbi:hypothetical protein J6590_078244 [Homalodisca vitripennis]|nr:hypothetical protein J6590_078244 [Homalodisca vitripennis]
MSLDVTLIMMEKLNETTTSCVRGFVRGVGGGGGRSEGAADDMSYHPSSLQSSQLISHEINAPVVDMGIARSVVCGWGGRSEGAADDMSYHPSSLPSSQLISHEISEGTADDTFYYPLPLHPPPGSEHTRDLAEIPS